MEDQLTTKQVSEALAVSESTVKRWCDRGAIPTVRTLGGHRRIPLSGFLEFLEATNLTVVASIAAGLGIPAGADSSRSGTTAADSGSASSVRSAIASLGSRDGGSCVVSDLGSDSGTNTSQTLPSLEALQQTFAAALEVGDEVKCRKALADAYALTESFAVLADQFVAAAFHLLGEKWTCGEIEVYQERRGCEICVRVLHEFRRLIPPAPSNAPLAIGGSPEGDNYSLPSQLIDLVLRESMWRPMNLGCNLPLSTILAAAKEHSPKMIWLSVSHLADPKNFRKDYAAFHAALPPNTMIVLGGRALNDQLRPSLKYTGFCDSMQQLTAFATALHGSRPRLDSSAN